MSVDDARPYDFGNILAHTEKLLGYHIEFRADKNETKARWRHVYTDSQQTLQKIRLLHNELVSEHTALLQTIRDVGNGLIYPVQQLTTNPDNARQLLELSDDLSDFEVSNLTTRLLYTALTIGRFKAGFLAQDRVRFESLEDSQTQPLTPEDMGGLLMPAFRTIFEKHPEARP